MNDFKKAKEHIRNISMTSAEKEMVLERIMEKTRKSAAPIRSPWTVFTFTSWVSSHRMATVFAIVLLLGLGGNSLITSANSALPGDALYSLKVNIAEPMRLALAPDFTTEAEVQSEIVQTRFEEAELLAVRGNLDETTEKQLSDSVSEHVNTLNAKILKIKEVSVEKANEVTDIAQAGVRAHARLLTDISVGRGEKMARLSDATREAAVALGDEPQVLATTRATNQAWKETTLMKKSEPAADAASSAGISAALIVPANAPVSPVADEIVSATSSETVAADTSVEMTQRENKNDRNVRRAKMSEPTVLMSVENSSLDREARKVIKEEEIFQKAKEKLEKRGKGVKLVEDIL